MKEVVTPDVIALCAATSACEKGAQWEQALSLLADMKKAGVTPDVISFNAATSACEKGAQWEQALSWLANVNKAGMIPNVTSSGWPSWRARKACSGSEHSFAR